MTSPPGDVAATERGPEPDRIRALLERVHEGEPGAADDLLSFLYAELRRQAQLAMARQPAGHTLQATALVHEAYLRLMRPREEPFRNREHFLAAAATAMRCVLVDHARRKRRKKRSADGEEVPLDQIVVGHEERAFDLLALDLALEELAGFDATMARAVELRFFAGLTVDEVADVLGMSKRTFERHWGLTRRWLYQRVT